jgi:hypothetical protein
MRSTRSPHQHSDANRSARAPVRSPSAAESLTPGAHALHGRAAHGTLTPQALLSLQRSVGNQAVSQLLRGNVSAPGAATITPLSRTTTVGHLQRDELDDLYGERAKENQQKQSYLADFQRILTLLKDKDRVLRILRQSLLAQPTGWQGRLATAEQQANFAPARPVLIGAVPADFFRSMIGAGQPFEDMLGGAHGIHSHRIQWYVVQHDIAQSGTYHHTALELYKEAGNAFWKDGKGNYMWDNVVDRQDFTEFASPEWVSFNLGKETGFRSTQEDDQEAASTKQQFLQLWKTAGPQEDVKHGIFDQEPVENYIFTGFNAQGKPTVVYNKNEAQAIPTG